MAVINSIQLPDGTQYDLQDAVGNYATQTYVDNAVAGVTKGTIGLGNVDNTSDMNKPVSTAQQTALNAKANNTLIAKVEASTTATQRYEIGDQFILNGVLYKATSIIANGGTITIGTNCTAADTIVKQISDNNGKKKYLLISDSYGGYTSGVTTYSWIDDVISLTGIDATKLSQGDIGFRPAHDAISSFYKLLNDAITNNTLGDLKEYTDIIVGGGANDIVNIATEAITKSGIITKIGEFVTLCRSNFPNANIYIGMIGNVKSSNYAKSYYETLEAYRECREFGAGYLENVEYILGMDLIKTEDGIHPTPEGFVELGKYMSEAVINKSCNVNRPMRLSTNTAAMNAQTVGSWNLVPATKISQCNGKQKVVFSQVGIGATMVAANIKALDNITPDITIGTNKFFAIGELTVGHVKGGAYVGDHYEPYYVGTAPVTCYVSTGKYFGINCPLALINGVLYLVLPAGAAYAEMLYGSNAEFANDILYIYISYISIEIDASNYNGVA